MYGHTAIRYQDTRQGINIAVNYGMFSFRKPYFILRFIFGLTDYEMGIVPFERFLMEYEFTKRGVFEQELNLTDEDKTRLAEAIATNYLPENRTYRYNYLYDNCTTRARDIITRSIGKGEQIKFNEDVSGAEMSYRDMIHLYNENSPWARFGKDLLLGIKADFPINRAQKQFLPDVLKDDFQKAIIYNKDSGTSLPLVKTSKWIIGPFNNIGSAGFGLRPIHCAWILFVISIISVAVEIKRKKMMWGLDLALMLTTGLAGVIIFLMIFSQHPTTSLNLQILILNPIPLFFAYRSVRRTTGMRKDNFWLYSACCILIFLAGSLFQCYAEGMCITASALLTRCISHIYNTRSHEA